MSAPSALSEVGAETIRRAHAVHPIADPQIEYSLFSRGIEDGILDTCRELGIGITAYGCSRTGCSPATTGPRPAATRAHTCRASTAPTSRPTSSWWRQILTATEGVLRRYGPAKATVVDAARELGVSHAAV